MRKLVTIRTINDLSPIKGADRIEVATIDGWKVVVKKNEFSVNDKCVYFEIDSFLPESDPRFAFLMKNGVKTFTDNQGTSKGVKLRTVTLRNQLSQGLALPLGTQSNSLFPEIWDYIKLNNFTDEQLSELDFSDLLHIKKWEPEIPSQLSGLVKGAFPSFIPKTDEERCQNLITEIFEENKDTNYEVSVKMDGSSCTFYHNNGVVGACGRNWEFKVCDENMSNSMVNVLLQSGLNKVLPSLGNIAIQGEMCGPGIQGNNEALKKPTFFIFNMYFIDTGKYATSAERVELYNTINQSINSPLIQHVPIIYSDVNLAKDLKITNTIQLIDFADGPSLNGALREGVVFKSTNLKKQFSFKSISNKYLHMIGD